MKINYRRGFNRLFVVLTASWALFVLIGTPFMMQSYKRYMVELVLSDSLALKPDKINTQEDVDRVQGFARNFYDQKLKETTMPIVLAEQAKQWRVWLALIVIPPLVVYLILVGVTWLFRWVSNGFSSASSASSQGP